MSDPRSIETSGPDIESAITKGVTELGVSRSDVMVEVLEEPGRRLLGLGAKHARVRLTVIRAPDSPPVAPAKIEQVEKPPSEKVTASAPAEKAAAPEREKPPARERAARTDFDEDWYDDDGGEVAISPADLAQDAKVGADTLQELLRHLEIDASVVAKAAKLEDSEPQHWTLEIQGRDLGALIGRRGETLAALQYITRLIASRDLERRANIVIDVEGYKSRREMMLRRLAKRMAEQAVQRGRTVSLEPMPPHERRIIHLALRDNPNVTTESVGDGDRRKVTIVPRRQAK
jgi:spoIIIJ-associated protein